MKIKRSTLILILLLVSALGFALASYWPLFGPAKAPNAGQQPVVVHSETNINLPEPKGIASPEAQEVVSDEAYMFKQIKSVLKQDKLLTDPFTLRIAVTRKIVEVPKTETASPGATVLTVQKPKPGLKLEGIWIDSGMRVAFISGRTLVEGNSIMGWKLLKIYPEQIILKQNNKVKILKLEVIFK